MFQNVSCEATSKTKQNCQGHRGLVKVALQSRKHQRRNLIPEKCSLSSSVLPLEADSSLAYPFIHSFIHSSFNIKHLLSACNSPGTGQIIIKTKQSKKQNRHSSVLTEIIIYCWGKGNGGTRRNKFLKTKEKNVVCPMMISVMGKNKIKRTVE